MSPKKVLAMDIEINVDFTAGPTLFHTFLTRFHMNWLIKFGRTVEGKYNGHNFS